MNSCFRCGLIFDAEPVEIGRSAIDPNYCILCEGSIMITSTHTKTIKVHTLIIDDNECERYIDDPDSLVELLNGLLSAKPDQPNGHHAPQASAARIKREKKSEPGEIIQCPKCGMRVKARGLLVHQRGSKCKAQALLTKT